MKRAFTLVELLVVVAIMAMMGYMSVGGYRSMQRGMEDRGAMQNVNQFIRSAYQRAQIDRTPVAVYVWNETTAEETDDDIELVHGHMLAVRRAGRLTNVTGKYLCDEYGDLRFNRLVVNEDEENESTSSADDTSAGSSIYLYRMNGDEGSQVMRSIVGGSTRRVYFDELLLLGGEDERLSAYAYVMQKENGVTWKTGDAYGFEFASLDLPNGYIFGSEYSRSISSPVKGEDVLRFKVSANSGNGAREGTDGKSTLTVSALRPNAGGNVEAQSVGTTDDPTQDLQN